MASTFNALVQYAFSFLKKEKEEGFENLSSVRPKLEEFITVGFQNSEIKSFIGVITSLNRGEGVINNEIYFREDILRSSKFSIGEKVEGTAIRVDNQHAWRAKEIYVATDKWEDQNDNTQEHSLVGRSSSMPTIIGKVNTIYGNLITLNTQVSFYRDEENCKFNVCVGDWVQCTRKKDVNSEDTHGFYQASIVTPLRRKVVYGTVTSFKSTFIVVNAEIYCPRLLVKQRIAARDRVIVEVIESDQEHYNWRAIRIQLDPSMVLTKHQNKIDLNSLMRVSHAQSEADPLLRKDIGSAASAFTPGGTTNSEFTPGGPTTALIPEVTTTALIPGGTTSEIIPEVVTTSALIPEVATTTTFIPEVTTTSAFIPEVTTTSAFIPEVTTTALTSEVTTTSSVTPEVTTTSSVTPEVTTIPEICSATSAFTPEVAESLISVLGKLDIVIPKVGNSEFLKLSLNNAKQGVVTLQSVHFVGTGPGQLSLDPSFVLPARIGPGRSVNIVLYCVGRKTGSCFEEVVFEFVADSICCTESKSCCSNNSSNSSNNSNESGSNWANSGGSNGNCSINSSKNSSNCSDNSNKSNSNCINSNETNGSNCTYSTFCIKIQIKITVLDNTANTTAKKLYQGHNPGLTRGTRVIQGEKPYHASPFIPTKLPYAEVPPTLLDAVLQGGKVTDLVPVLCDDLNAKNYEERFATLLFLEEIQMLKMISQFDIPYTPFFPHGEYLSLFVEGLSEGRPSLLVGDSVLASPPLGVGGDAPAATFEGFVHHVLQSKVLLKFHPNFHSDYKGEDFSVQFRFNRTPLRRCHLAVSMVTGVLGPRVLFPTKLEFQLPQVTFMDPDFRVFMNPYPSSVVNLTPNPASGNPNPGSVDLDEHSNITNPVSADVNPGCENLYPLPTSLYPSSENPNLVYADKSDIYPGAGAPNPGSIDTHSCSKNPNLVPADPHPAAGNPNPCFGHPDVRMRDKKSFKSGRGLLGFERKKPDNLMKSAKDISKNNERMLDNLNPHLDKRTSEKLNPFNPNEKVLDELNPCPHARMFDTLYPHPDTRMLDRPNLNPHPDAKTSDKLNPHPGQKIPDKLNPHYPQISGNSNYVLHYPELSLKAGNCTSQVCKSDTRSGRKKVKSGYLPNFPVDENGYCLPVIPKTAFSKGPHNAAKIPTLLWFNNTLNMEQKSAVRRILEGATRPIPYIIFGPPGTGKTVTLVEAMLQIYKMVPHSRILAVCPSNSACDLLAERAIRGGGLKQGELVRLNAFNRNIDSIPEDISAYCVTGSDLQIVVRHRVIVATATTSGLLYTARLKSGHFTHVFVDEAGQLTEPETCVALGLVNSATGQIVLAGDPKQLGPVVVSPIARRFGLNQSLLHRLCSTVVYQPQDPNLRLVYSDASPSTPEPPGWGPSKPPDKRCQFEPRLVTLLTRNYRSHPALLKVPSGLFYHSCLVPSADDQVVNRLLTWNELPNPKCPLIFHPVRGENLQEGDSPSWYNPAEAFQAVRYALSLKKFGLHESDIGIITPYKKQVEKIRKLLTTLTGGCGVKVGPVEEFQGQEKVAIILSTVRSSVDIVENDVNHNLGFVRCAQRFNVAITRSIALLVVIGNPDLLCLDSNWNALIQYSIEMGAVKSRAL